MLELEARLRLPFVEVVGEFFARDIKSSGCDVDLSLFGLVSVLVEEDQ